MSTKKKTTNNESKSDLSQENVTDEVKAALDELKAVQEKLEALQAKVAAEKETVQQSETQANMSVPEPIEAEVLPVADSVQSAAHTDLNATLQGQAATQGVASVPAPAYPAAAQAAQTQGQEATQTTSTPNPAQNYSQTSAGSEAHVPPPPPEQQAAYVPSQATQSTQTPQNQQYQYQQNYQTQAASSKDHIAAGLLGIFLGFLGIHKFYLGYNTSGFIMLAVTVIGSIFTLGIASFVVWIIAIIEAIMYLTKSQAEFEQIYVLNRREWF